jgi:hypothetical protein
MNTAPRQRKSKRLRSPNPIPVRTRKMLDQSAAHLKRRLASEPIDLAVFLKR